MIGNKFGNNSNRGKRKTVFAVLCVGILCIAALSLWRIGSVAPSGEPIICIDAGHGGSDVGATYEGRYEKDDNLRLALAVGEILEENGIKVVYTRTKDEFVSLEDRAKFANKKYATYFVSLHRNSADTDVSGVEIWIRSDSHNDEAKLAAKILDKIDEVGYGKNRGVKRGYQSNPYADYVVNKSTDMPSCLIEMGFITTARDNELFDKNFDEYARAVAEGIMAGIEPKE